MACNNCFNGCAETISDQCVKYTGIDIPGLGIENGDSLAAVEAAITTFLLSTINGTGIIPIIASSDICAIISNNLPECTECNGFTLNDILTAIIKSTCQINTQVTNINATLTTLNADYNVQCLTGVTNSSDTHDILQAVINRLCSLNSSFDVLVGTLPSTYLALVNVPSTIAAYLTSQNFLASAKDRMIPYSPVAYFGNLANFPNTGDSFSISGVGAGYWDKVYLCNGQNGTPDLRGRVLVGVTTGMGGSAYNSAVDPSNPQNPNYALNSVYGANSVTLGVGQIPSHTHTISNVVNVIDPEHSHNIQGGASGSGYPKVDNGLGVTGQTTSSATGISVTVASTAAVTGGSGAHNNVQPVYAGYYIIYIP